MFKNRNPKSSVVEIIFKFLCSLKLTVVVISTLALALACGTILESLHDTRTAQFFVYGSLWFHLVLASLAVNLFSVMVDRWPWQRKHTPFLLAHIGILTLLAGSWITERFGLDGTVRINEGETAHQVELDRHSFVISNGGSVLKIPVPWIPPQIGFHPISLKGQGLPYDLTIDQFLSHAEPEFSFVPNSSQRTNQTENLAAARIKIEGGPMRVSQELWLWMGEAEFQSVEMGPARFGIGAKPLPTNLGHPSFSIISESDGFRYRAVSSDGRLAQGHVTSSAAVGHVIDPKWKGGVKLTILDWQPSASPLTRYKSARMQYGTSAPASAIHVIVGNGGPGAETWLGTGDHVRVLTPQGAVGIGYFPDQVALPFSVKLKQFKVERYDGSQKPSSFSSQVTVDGGQASTISMNEPLASKGITLYQASYEDALPRPTVSILSVNRDPGRLWKYFGSLLIVVGSVLLFGAKYRKNKHAAMRPNPLKEHSLAFISSPETSL